MVQGHGGTGHLPSDLLGPRCLAAIVHELQGLGRPEGIEERMGAPGSCRGIDVTGGNVDAPKEAAEAQSHACQRGPVMDPSPRNPAVAQETQVAGDQDQGQLQ